MLEWRPSANESINKIIALLSRILFDAAERGYLRDNPGRRVRRLRHRTPRRPILEPQQVWEPETQALRIELNR